MARARNIKPAFFTNELLGTEDPMVSLTFAGLWCLADKMGILEDRPLRIKAELFPYRDSLDVNGYLSVLARLGFVVRYENAGKGYIQVCAFRKHQSPHHTEKAKGFPFPSDPKSLIKEGNGYLTVKEPNKDGESQVPERSDSLIPDSGFTDSGFTDSLIPDSLIPDSKTLAVSDESQTAPQEPQAAKSKAKSKQSGEETDHQIACRATWDSYSKSYFNRYGADPVRNAKVNAQVKQLVLRLGAEEAPSVAAFFVTINDAYYIRSSHELGLLLAKAEGIRTQWATGRQMNGRTARQLEDTQANKNAAQEAASRIRDKGEVKKNAFL